MRADFYYTYGKRWFDMTTAAVGIIFLWPIMILIGVAICIESYGGPFYIQSRIGRAMVPFNLIKFRSMRRAPITDRTQFEPGGSSRVTHLGKFLRQTKLDEMPQLFNVFIGEMSIVGPRPEVKKYVVAYEDDFAEILKLRPGLSDNASLKYRDEEQLLKYSANPEKYYRDVVLPDKLCLAKNYVKNLTLKSDLQIIARTVKKLIS